MGTRIPSVRDAARTDKGAFACTVNPDPFPPRTNVLLVVARNLSHGHEKGVHSDGFVFSRLTAAACALPAGKKSTDPIPDFLLRFPNQTRRAEAGDGPHGSLLRTLDGMECRAQGFRKSPRGLRRGMRASG